MPLNQINAIQERLTAVGQLIRQIESRQDLNSHIKSIGDLERLAAKVPLKKINPREVMQIAKGLTHVKDIKLICAQVNHPYINRLGDALNACEYLLNKINEMLVEQPPVQINKGGIIREGIHEELDQLRIISSGGKQYLIELQQKEAQATGISSLKISFNNVFGYYLEVTNLHKSKVPDTWIRKQTLANAERYITPELKTYEEKILGAEDKIILIEQQLFSDLLHELQDYISPLQVNANVIATLDCLIGFSILAIQQKYIEPEIHDGNELSIKDSRHPVIEQHLPVGETYITNDLELSSTDQQIIILTGPNMSGKSAILRQTALITLMAHMGSFVPASAAKIPLTDKIFTRVGASDNLSGGESTFMVEMNETESIINNLSSRSLILLDEIGRGTSTYDGISIAWSIAEYLHNHPHKPKTLFATHYHELNELEKQCHGIKNFHITNKEVGNKVIFLRKLAPGGSTHSFGIHVARMAGMPVSLIDRANELLKILEESRDQDQEVKNKLTSIPSKKVQLSIFDAHTVTFESIRTLLNEVDINRLTPVEALLKLQEIKGKLN
jgi:DNA mismatch repair protein MutS